MTGLLAQLTALFYKKLKIAMMTFDHEYYVEFCFDEYDNTDQGRAGAGIGIGTTPYVRPGQDAGTRWTHTAGAAQCACQYMLTPTCGLTDPAADCINVIFITDGPPSTSAGRYAAYTTAGESTRLLLALETKTNCSLNACEKIIWSLTSTISSISTRSPNWRSSLS